MSAATAPTFCLSIPVTTSSVWLGASTVIPSGTSKTTGCENPSCRLSFLPCTCARYPTPTSSSFLTNPSDTPCTIFASNARVVPDIAVENREPDRGLTVTSFSTCTNSISEFKSRDREPFAPFTVAVVSLRLNSTPLMISTGYFAILDIIVSLSGAYRCVRKRRTKPHHLYLALWPADRS